MQLKAFKTESAPDVRVLEELLSAVAAGDRDALAGLYERCRAPVYAMALSCLRNAHDAQDLTQDVFVRVWERAGQYRSQGSPMAWLLTLCRNEALSRLRTQGREGTLEPELWDAIPAEPAGLTPDERVLLQTALAALENRERQVVLLHAVTGLRHREIAALLELPLATVLSKYHRALKKMRAYLEGDDAR